MKKFDMRKTIFQIRKTASEHGFTHQGNNYATLPWFGTKIAQKHAKRIKTKTWSTQGFVATWNATFSTSGQRQVTTFCTCTMTSRKKSHVSGCRRQAGDVCCLRCLIIYITQPCPQVFSVNGSKICSGLHFWRHFDVIGSIIFGGLHFWRHLQYGEDSFQIWSTAAGYGELCLWF